VSLLLHPFERFQQRNAALPWAIKSAQPAWLHLRLTQSTQKSAKSKEETPRAAPAPAAPPKSGADFLLQMILYMHTMYIYIYIIAIFYCYCYYCYITIVIFFLFLLYIAIMFVIVIIVIIIIMFRVLFS
jgi:hypothetical protein